MSSPHQIGSLCEDCLRYGLQNYLKSFYINFDEQIVKCESSSCMFPYLRKPLITDISNSKPPESAIFLDEFIEQRFKEIDDTPVKADIGKCTTKSEIDTSDMYDFSAIFMDYPIKSEVKEKPLMVQTVKQEPPPPPPLGLESKMNKIKNSKPNPTKKQMQPPKKFRISRCLSDVKSTSKTSNCKRSKPLSEKIEPVLVIEPQSGKSMRPLDLIKRYLANKKN